MKKIEERLRDIGASYLTFVDPDEVIGVEETDDHVFKSIVYLRGGKSIKVDLATADILARLNGEGDRG